MTTYTEIEADPFLVDQANWGEKIVRFGEYHLPPFPIEALPSWQRAFVEELAASTQTPPDLAAMQVLAVSAMAVAKAFQLCIKNQWIEPVNLYLLTVLPSGERKSPVFRAAVAPVREYERSVNAQLAPVIAAALSTQRMLQARLKQAESEAVSRKDKPGRQEAEDDAKKLVTESEDFQVPVSLRLIADDITPEKLASLLEEQGERLAILAAEGGIFETIAGRYAQGVPNVDIFLKAYSGDPHETDRVSRPPVQLLSPALTLGLAVQPDVLRGLREKKGFRGRGFLGRFLYSLPQSKVGYRPVTAPSMRLCVIEEYAAGVKQLLSLGEAEDANGKFNVQTLYLTTDAIDHFDVFRERAEKALRPGQGLGDMQDWGNKFPGNVARLAAILHLAEHGDTDCLISEATMSHAIQLGEYFMAHARAAYDQMGMDEETDDTLHLLAWIKRDEVEKFTRRGAHNALQGRFKRVEQLDRPLQILIDRHFIQEAPLPSRIGAGRKPSPTYWVSPYLNSSA